MTLLASIAELAVIAGGVYAGSMRYPGGKSGSGVYQTIINQMPPHQVYIEPFLGSGAVMRHKLPARINVGLDLDIDVISMAADIAAGGDVVQPGARLALGCDGRPQFCFERADAVQWLGILRWWTALLPDCLVYCDPPYLMSTRSSKRRMYRYELEEPGHIALLDVLVQLPCRVMVSGYESALYLERLSAWRVVRYRAITSGGGMRTECLWCNFPEPTELHDYRFLGRGFRERERIRRRLASWVAMLERMPVLERAAVINDLRESAAQGRTS
jgi:DNA adenine methylase